MSELGPPEFVKTKSDKPEKTWQHHLSIGLKVFLILLGVAILFTALDAPCIFLAAHGTHC